MIYIIVTDMYKDGGLQRTVSNLVSKVENFDFTIISLFKSSNDLMDPDLKKLDNCKIVNIFNEKFNKYDYYIKGPRKVRNLIKKNELNSIVISTGFFHNFLLVNLPKNTKRVVWLHYRLNSYKKISSNYLFELYSRFFIDKIIFINEVDYKNNKFKNDKIIFIKNILSDNSSDYLINNKMKSSGKMKIIMIGSLEPWKNHLKLLSVLDSKFIREKVIIDIYGEGSLRHDLYKYIDVNNLQGTVNLLGYVENVDKYISSYDLLVHPSMKEGYGLVIIEAIKSKVPVLAFNNDGIAQELFIDKVHGEIIEQNTFEAMVQRLYELYSNRYLLKKYKNNLLKNPPNYSNIKAISAWVSLLEELYNEENSNS